MGAASCQDHKEATSEGHACLEDRGSKTGFCKPPCSNLCQRRRGLRRPVCGPVAAPQLLFRMLGVTVSPPLRLDRRCGPRHVRELQPELSGVPCILNAQHREAGCSGLLHLPLLPRAEEMLRRMDPCFSLLTLPQAGFLLSHLIFHSALPISKTWTPQSEGTRKEPADCVKSQSPTESPQVDGCDRQRLSGDRPHHLCDGKIPNSQTALPTP